MENEQTKAVDEFLGDLKNNGQEDPFKAPDDPFASIEQKENKKEPLEDGETEEKGERKSLPFHKDPKVQRYIEREIAKRIPEPREQREFQEQNTQDIDDVLGRIIGNDTPEKISAIKDFKQILLDREDRGAEKALREWQAGQEAEVQAEQEAEDTLLNGFESIEEEYGIDITSSSPQARKTRGEFVNFIRKVAPKDENGEIADYPDLVETFDAFKSTRQTNNSSNRAKELASRSNERGSGDSNYTQPKERISFESNEWEKFKETLR